MIEGSIAQDGRRVNFVRPWKKDVESRVVGEGQICGLDLTPRL